MTLCSVVMIPNADTEMIPWQKPKISGKVIELQIREHESSNSFLSF